jgi:DNA-binding MarR family transcriptional regulator
MFQLKRGEVMAELDELIHQPIRLQIMAALQAAGADAEVEFTFLRGRLRCTDGNLGSHLDKLAAARYVVARKTFSGRKPVTYLSMTRAGRRAFEDYLTELKGLLDPLPASPMKKQPYP